MLQSLLNMLKLLYIFLVLLHRGYALSCYDCSSEPDYDDYDENCMNDDYDGMLTSSQSFHSCYIEVYENGKVERYAEIMQYTDGECEKIESSVSYWRCHCTSDKCNNDLCQHCYQSSTDQSTTPTTEPTTIKTTETTTEATTVTTTEMIEPTTVTTTVTSTPTTVTTTGTTESTTVTTTVTPKPTTITTTGTTKSTTVTTTVTPKPTTVTTTEITDSTSSIGLCCYSCIDCPVVDMETPHVVDPLFQTCVTVVMGPESMVLRAGDYDLREDGECTIEDGGLFCYCVGNLCNNIHYKQ